jgi:hypothetical protein
VYSTKPWPSSSTQRRLKSSIVTSPPFGQIGKSFAAKMRLKSDAQALCRLFQGINRAIYGSRVPIFSGGPLPGGQIWIRHLTKMEIGSRWGLCKFPVRYDHIFRPQRAAVNPSPRANEIMHGVMKMLANRCAYRVGDRVVTAG